MSINIIKTPPSFQPVLTNGLFYTISADTTNTFKFRYTYDLYINGDVVFQGISTPNPFGLGVIDVSRILKTYCENNPIAVWDTTDIYTHKTFPFSRPYKDEVINYQVYFGFEYANSELTPVTGFTGVISGQTGAPGVESPLRKTFHSTMGVNGRANQQDFNMTPFVLSGTPIGTNPTTSGLFLTNSPRTRNIQESEWYTLSFTNYYLDSSTLSEPYYVEYNFYDDQGILLTGVTIDNITTNGGGPRTDCNYVYQELPIIIPSGGTDYNTLYVGAGPQNLLGIIPSGATNYTVQLFGKFTGTTEPIQPTPTPTPTPSPTPIECVCKEYYVYNQSLEAQAVITYATCPNRVEAVLVVNPGQEFFICACDGEYVIEGTLIVIEQGLCEVPSPSPTPTPTPTPSPTYSSWSVQTCSDSCSGGVYTCVGNTPTTLYMAVGNEPDYELEQIYTDSALTTPYVGIYQYAGCIFINDAISGIYQDGCLGDPC